MCLNPWVKNMLRYTHMWIWEFNNAQMLMQLITCNEKYILGINWGIFETLEFMCWCFSKKIQKLC